MSSTPSSPNLLQQALALAQGTGTPAATTPVTTQMGPATVTTPAVMSPVAGTPTSPSRTLAVLKPIMGGLTDDGKGGQVAYTCGKPKSGDWKDGLDAVSLAKPPEINHRRPMDNRGGALKEAALSEGLKVKFVPDKESIVGFCKRFFIRAKEQGQETITFVSHHGKMDSLLMNLYCVSEEDITNLIAVRAQDYDSYDHQNDRTLKKALYASLPPELQAKAATKDLEMSERGNWFFLQALLYVRNLVSPNIFNELHQHRHDISKLTASAFPQQDIGMLCDAFKPKVDALSLAGMLDPLALKQMLQAFVDADWGTSEKYELAGKASALDKMLESLSQMSPSDRDSKLEDEKLDHTSILDLVRQLWTAAKRGGTYPPASNAPDRRAVPSQFNQANTLTQVTPRDRNSIAPQHGATRDRGRNGGGPGRGRGYGRGTNGQQQRQGQHPQPLHLPPHLEHVATWRVGVPRRIV